MRHLNTVEVPYNKGSDLKSIQESLPDKIDEAIRANGYKQEKNSGCSRLSGYFINYSNNQVEFHVDSKRSLIKPRIKFNFCLNCYNPKNKNQNNIFQKSKKMMKNLKSLINNYSIEDQVKQKTL
ncbi:MAG: hypothetical protein JSW73_02130 [Candidatus Woesearchaeota archaeon]|nr:MAG: hypothetical protein JSW73_02130 [Candidatus Woesearchaeota archaeon]